MTLTLPPSSPLNIRHNKGVEINVILGDVVKNFCTRLFPLITQMVAGEIFTSSLNSHEMRLYLVVWWSRRKKTCKGSKSTWVDELILWVHHLVQWLLFPRFHCLMLFQACMREKIWGLGCKNSRNFHANLFKNLLHKAHQWNFLRLHSLDPASLLLVLLLCWYRFISSYWMFLHFRSLPPSHTCSRQSVNPWDSFEFAFPAFHFPFTA